MIVADTNTILYLLIPGERTASAEAVMAKDGDWTAPALWRHEMRNALSLYLRTKKLPLPVALEVMAAAEGIVKPPPEEPASTEVLALSTKSGCSSYDCEFAALARNLNIPLVTSDAKLLQAFPTVAVSPDRFVGR